MTEIPETWPPRPTVSVEAPAVPLFPLPGVFLYPHQLVPLHVFEPRYLAMMRDILDSHGQLVIGTVLRDQQDRLLDEDAPPQVLSVGGLGEVARYDKTKDGRYLIWVLGRERVTLEEAASEHPYRLVHTTPLPESAPREADVPSMVRDLRAAILQRHKNLDQLPEELPVGVLVDLLAQQIDVPQEVLERLYCEPDVGARATTVLRAHEAYPQE